MLKNTEFLLNVTEISDNKNGIFGSKSYVVEIPLKIFSNLFDVKLIPTDSQEQFAADYKLVNIGLINDKDSQFIFDETSKGEFVVRTYDEDFYYDDANSNIFINFDFFPKEEIPYYTMGTGDFGRLSIKEIERRKKQFGVK